jgi:hypothetical protein
MRSRLTRGYQDPPDIRRGMRDQCQRCGFLFFQNEHTRPGLCEVHLLCAALEEAAKALLLARSVIKCREQWSETCESEIGGAIHSARRALEGDE